jgi:hypothetical protein
LKRAAEILFCTLLLSCAASAQLLSAINGELRYQYQYQDYVSAGLHTITSTQSPMLRLGGSGALINPSLVSFDLQSLIFLTSSNARVSQYSLSSKSFTWDYYNVAFTILPGSPVTTSLQLNDGITKSSSSSAFSDFGEDKLRRQQINLMMMTHQIPFLPTIRLSIFRTHQWTQNADRPVNEINTNYAMNLTTGGKDGSVSVSGSMSENSDRYSGTTMRYYTLLLNGTRNFSERQNFHYNLNYYRYSDATNISGLATYMNSSNEQFRSTTTLNTHNYSGPAFQSNLTSLSEQIQFIQDEHFRYSLGLNGSYGKEESSTRGAENGTRGGGSANISVQHSRRLSQFAFSNGFSIGYGLMRYLDRQASFNTGFSNTFSMPFSTYEISAAHTVSYGFLQDDQRRRWVSNNANVDFSGTTIYHFQTQILTTFLADNNSGDLPAGLGNSRELRLQWLVNTPQLFYDRLQFNLGFSGGEEWFFVNAAGRISTWSLTFSCAQSYIRNLSVSYHFNRNYDRITRQESIGHAVEMHYQWRAISMDLRFDNLRLIDNRSNLLLIFSRSF